jgi:hypothetical protein
MEGRSDGKTRKRSEQLLDNLHEKEGIGNLKRQYQNILGGSYYGPVARLYTEFVATVSYQELLFAVYELDTE